MPISFRSLEERRFNHRFHRLHRLGYGLALGQVTVGPGRTHLLTSQSSRNL
jgi:hypothetical protein